MTKSIQLINQAMKISPSPVGDEIIWQHSGVDVCQRRFVMGNLKDRTLKEIWETDEYETFREKFRQRKEYYDEKLSTVSYSLSGCCGLDTARYKIKNYFMSHSTPKQCLACAKRKGY